MKVPAHKDTIMIHCLATPPSWGKGKSASQAVAEVYNWHTRDNGWSDIAYAEVIGYEGDWAKGRDLDKDGDVWEETGAGARGWNRNGIHIALVGGSFPNRRWGKRTDKFSDHFTPEQDATLRARIAAIQAASDRPLRVIGHNEVDPNKGCPSFDVQEWLRAAPLASAAPQATSAGTGSSPAPSKNPIVAILNAIFKALGLNKGGPA